MQEPNKLKGLIIERGIAPEGEETKQWDEIDVHLQELCAMSFRSMVDVRITSPDLIRIFDQARPKMVFGVRADQTRYLKISEDSLEIMQDVINLFL